MQGMCGSSPPLPTAQRCSLTFSPIEGQTQGLIGTGDAMQTGRWLFHPRISGSSAPLDLSCQVVPGFCSLRVGAQKKAFKLFDFDRGPYQRLDYPYTMLINKVTKFQTDFYTNQLH